MNKEKYMKNGVFSLEYDKETLRDMIFDLQEENQRLNNVLNELEKIIQSDAKIYCCSESAMKSFKTAERIYKSYLLNELKELKEK